MKNVFFAFVAVSVVILSACNNKPAESTVVTTDSVAVTTSVVTDSVATVADSTAAPATK